MNRIGIIDYGMGNLHSVAKALQAVGAGAEIVHAPDQLAACDRLVLPGVGAFGDAMANLHQRNLVAPLLEAVAAGKPLLGICLGMQILFSSGEEMGFHQGLALLEGTVRRLQVSLKVPHMGWNRLRLRAPSPLVAGIDEGAFVYFANSYVVVPQDRAVIAAETEYEQFFPAVVWRNHVHGVQFHPEKSQRVGLRLLQNFVERC